MNTNNADSFFNPNIDTDFKLDFDLITAASLGDSQAVKGLLANKQDPNMVNGSGWSALMYAATYGHYGVVRLLLEAGADVSCKQPSTGRTPLMMAAANGHTRCVEVLLKEGKARLEDTDKCGKTAAYYASASGHGNNKVISQLLGIRNNRNATRDIIRSTQALPSIVIGSPNDSGNQSTRNRIRADAPPFTPRNQCSPWSYHAKNGSNFGSNPQPMNTPVRHAPAVGETSMQSMTPRLDIVSSQGICRKRKIKSSTNDTTPSYTSSPMSALRQDNGNASKDSQISPVPPPRNLEELLKNIGLDIYKELFGTNGIDLYVFATLTDRDFLNLGISPVGHRRKLEIAQLRFRESVTITSTQESILADYLLIQLQETHKENELLKSQLAAFQMTQELQKLFPTQSHSQVFTS